MLVNHPQCCSAAALMNTGPQTELSVCRYSPITLENRIQLPTTLSLQKKTPRSPLHPSRPPDHISCSPVVPPAANLSQDLTFCDLPSSRTPTPAGPVTCITCCSFSQSDQLRFILWLWKCISRLLKDAFEARYWLLSFVYEIPATYARTLISLQRQSWICIWARQTYKYERVVDRVRPRLERIGRHESPIW